MFHGQRILLIIAGGIAAYKSLELIRRLREHGAAVRCILTHGGSQFITPLSVAALSEERVYQDLFSLTDEAEMGHIRLSREADLVVVVPATADLMAKMAAGLADDLASTALLATDKEVLIAPSMNVKMWQHAATQANLETLKARGIHVVGPGTGDLPAAWRSRPRSCPPSRHVSAADHWPDGGHWSPPVRRTSRSTRFGTWPTGPPVVRATGSRRRWRRRARTRCWSPVRPISRILLACGWSA